MEDLKNEYKKITDERENIISELKELKENEIVKRFLELSSKNNDLYNQQKDLLKNIKINEYEKCSHIWITTAIDYDSFEGRSEVYKGCIKCGLNQESLKHDREYYGIDFASYDERLMIDFIKKYGYITYNGLHSDEACDINLAKAIYKKIKENNPNIDDITAKKYFEIALDDIRKIKVSDERKINRAKRLSLNPNFKKWNRHDIRN